MTLDQLRSEYYTAKTVRDTLTSADLIAEMQAKMDRLKKAYNVQRRKNLARRERDDAMRSCGLVRVVGALGGVYWE
jgi:hypothetical protein